MAILRPLLVASGAKPIASVLMFTVKGDVHDIGKNLCNIMLEGAGFTVIDIGVNTTTDKMMAAVKQHNPPIVGMSAFLTTTMPMFKVNMEALTKEGLRDKVKVMVGGAPVTKEYATRVGADGTPRMPIRRCVLPKSLRRRWAIAAMNWKSSRKCLRRCRQWKR